MSNTAAVDDASEGRRKLNSNQRPTFIIILLIAILAAVVVFPLRRVVEPNDVVVLSDAGVAINTHPVFKAGYPVGERGPRAEIEVEGNASHIVYPVYFGTNRTITSPSVAPLAVSWKIALPSSATIVLAGILVFISRRMGWRNWFVTGSVAVLALIGVILPVFSIGRQVVARWGAVPSEFSPQPDNHLQVGICSVSIPLKHQIGRLEAPSLLRGELRQNVDEHIVLQRIEVLSDESFDKNVLASARKSAWSHEGLVFVHGFNVSFEDAARSAAQLSFDSKFGGVSAFFSWPSQGAFEAYDWDEQTVASAVDYFKEFLTRFAQSGELDRIHIVAHSMGNRCLSDMLELHGQSLPFKIEHCILAAPDVDLNSFKTRFASKMVSAVKTLTLYASDRDYAMKISKLKNGFPRAGDANPILVMDGIDSIDATNVTESRQDWTGHSYVYKCPQVLRDIQELLENGLPASERSQLSQRKVSELIKYWEMRTD